jgi:uncharacterized membrane protein
MSDFDWYVVIVWISGLVSGYFIRAGLEATSESGGRR